MSTVSIGIIVVLIIVSNAQWLSSLTKMPRVDSRMAIGYYNNSIFLIGGYQMWREQWAQFDIQSQKFVANKSISLSVQTWGTAQFYTQIDNKLFTIDVGKNYFNVFFLHNKTFIKNWPNIAEWSQGVGSSACLAYQFPYIFIVGGGSPILGTLNTLQTYNTLLQTWNVSLATLQTEREQLACITHAWKLYAIGGHDNSYNYLNSIEKLDFSGDIQQASWTNNAHGLTPAVVGSRAVNYNDYILVIGGKNELSSAYMTRVQIFNTINGVVSVSPFSLANAVYYTAPIIVDHVIYAFGGQDGSDNDIDSWQYGTGVLPTFNPTTFTSIPTNNPTTFGPTMLPTFGPTILPTFGPTILPTLVPTTSEPTLLPTSTAPTTTSYINPTEHPSDMSTTVALNKMRSTSANLEQLLFMILIVMLIIFAVIGLSGIVYSYKYERNILYKLKIMNLIVFVFYVSDFITDIFFAVSCYNAFSNNNDIVYVIIFFLSVTFIIFPSAINLIMLNKNIKHWIDDKSNGEKIAKWVDSYLSILFIVCFIVGNSKSAIKLFTSHLFGLNMFSLQLKPSQTMQLANEHVIVSFFENIPQIGLQIVFVLKSDDIRHINDVAIVALFCNVCGTIINCISLFTRKNILRAHGDTFDADHMSRVDDHLTDSLL